LIELIASESVLAMWLTVRINAIFFVPSLPKLRISSRVPAIPFEPSAAIFRSVQVTEVSVAKVGAGVEITIIVLAHPVAKALKTKGTTVATVTAALRKTWLSEIIQATMDYIGI
jgi:hypothetical protein